MSKGTWKKPTCQDLAIRALEAGKPMSVKEIASEIGMSYQNCKETMRRMLASEPKAAHISGWERSDAFHLVALFSLGNKEDAPRPEPAKHRPAERCRIWRAQKQVRDEEDIEKWLDRERVRKAQEALSQPAFRHPYDVALFGPVERRAA